MTAGRVYVVLVNYNGWRDTVECLESLLRSDYPDFRVIVCDNASPNDSVARLLAWADGQEAPAPVSGAMREFSHPPLPKPIPHAVLSAEQPISPAAGNELLFIRISKNLGFAGGCNVGMRVALADPATAYIWLLNNDTVVPPTALKRAVEKLGETSAVPPPVGMCGSSLLFYDAPTTVQAAGGGIYRKWWGITQGCGSFQSIDSIDEAAALRRLDYIAGAALLVTREFIETVGFMAEDYFLYFEELDWVRRARGRFALAYARESIVYHKEGGSIGTRSVAAQRSRLADEYGVRNRIRFTRRFHPYALPTVYLGLIGAIANRIRRRQFDRVGMILRAMLGL
jgi:GT2 family glycosyltransferase